MRTIAIVGVTLIAVLLSACDRAVSENSQRAPNAAQAEPALALMAGQSIQGFARADAARTFRFPADHGPHPDFRTEWWYLTGNLQTATGRRFGYQLTLFRLALASAEQSPPRVSRFATRQAWMGHFAISDFDADGGGGEFSSFERLERGAAGLAGASAAPFQVWIRDWKISGTAGLFPMRVQAAENGVKIDLQLGPGKALLLQGEAGLSRKSRDVGNASYYYSYTRLPSVGRLTTAQGEFEVHGQSWMDREWSSSALASDQVGWDWFSLQLDDGRDLMLYRLRDLKGHTHPFSAGVMVAADGSAEVLSATQMKFQPQRFWRANDGSEYPVQWQLDIPGLSLQVEAVFDAQRHQGRFRYWEGAVHAQGMQLTGRSQRRALEARGYLEMTGY